MSRAAARALTALLELMERLRDPRQGCPWDREQTFASIAPFTLEEAYEVADAIERDDPAMLREELGDLLFQVVFLSRMAQERGWFGFAQVADGIHEKLVRRHPHVFGGEQPADAEAQSRAWEAQKALERAQNSQQDPQADTSIIAGIPRALPALTRAEKLGRRAARVGFDWQHSAEVRAKVLEEMREIDEALDQTDDRQGHEDRTRARVAEEMGDLLFAVANWALHLKIDPEDALRRANAKFERRFRSMEAAAGRSGARLEALSAQEWDALWRQAKSAEGA